MTTMLLSLKQFCHDYGVSRATAYRLFAARQLAAVKIGTRTCVSIEEAERWRSSLVPFQPGLPGNSL